MSDSSGVSREDKNVQKEKYTYTANVHFLEVEQRRNLVVFNTLDILKINQHNVSLLQHMRATA